MGKDTFNITEIVINACAKNGFPKDRDRLFGFTHGKIVFNGVRECFAFVEGPACAWGKTKCAPKRFRDGSAIKLVLKNAGGKK